MLFFLLLTLLGCRMGCDNMISHLDTTNHTKCPLYAFKVTGRQILIQIHWDPLELNPILLFYLNPSPCFVMCFTEWLFSTKCAPNIVQCTMYFVLNYFSVKCIVTIWPQGGKTVADNVFYWGIVQYKIHRTMYWAFWVRKWAISSWLEG